MMMIMSDAGKRHRRPRLQSTAPRSAAPRPTVGRNKPIDASINVVFYPILGENHTLAVSNFFIFKSHFLSKF